MGEILIVKIKRANVNNNYLYIQRGGINFFPRESLGGENKNHAGEKLTFYISGTMQYIHTDIATSKSFLRDRTWFNNFFAHYKLKIGDEIVIEKFNNLYYVIYPRYGYAHDYEEVVQRALEQTNPKLNKVTVQERFEEGRQYEVTLNRYERNPQARRECINEYGLSCCVCKFNFEEKFGKIGINFIHVHHKIPLSEIGVAYKVNPIKDLIPVCPNCHAMLHRRNPPYTIEELKTIRREDEC